MHRKTVTKIRFLLDGSEQSAKGRDAWALGELLEAGGRGVTPIDNPGPRWSGYVLKLRKAGIVIQTIYERHGGPFAGKHARYVLRSQIEVIEKRESA